MEASFPPTKSNLFSTQKNSPIAVTNFELALMVARYLKDSKMHETYKKTVSDEAKLKSLREILSDYVILCEERNRRLSFRRVFGAPAQLTNTIMKLETVLDDYMMFKNGEYAPSSDLIQPFHTMPQEPPVILEESSIQPSRSENKDTNKLLQSPRRKTMTPKKLTSPTKNQNLPILSDTSREPISNIIIPESIDENTILKVFMSNPQLQEKLAEQINHSTESSHSLTNDTIDEIYRSLSTDPTFETFLSNSAENSQNSLDGFDFEKAMRRAREQEEEGSNKKQKRDEGVQEPVPEGLDVEDFLKQLHYT
eukprot:TRINITY_DN6691_c0_g1_i1.p1 TRINITY_DN6691_c0_g1~~TRINITY_DN6691_c0_g1_i1.p1  ORF type:complete len:325 (-),score=69.49 TRINITY_DN6691_c0_g1_i1:300-1226(-)